MGTELSAEVQESRTDPFFWMNASDQAAYIYLCCFPGYGHSIQGVALTKDRYMRNTTF